MKTITILSHHLGLQGSFLNLLDFNHYLQQQGYKTLFYTFNIIDLYHVTRSSKRLHTFNELKLLKDYKPDSSATVVTDFKTLIKSFKMNMRIDCNKLIIMDNNEISYHLNDIKEAKFYHKNLNINRLIKPLKYKEILFLIPPSNVDKFRKKYPDIPFKVFFKKINWDLLKQINYQTKDVLWYRFDDINIQDQMKNKYGSQIETRDEYDEIDLWDYKGMIYYRRKHLEYYEQYGRLIFEFIMLGKEVHFLNNPFEKEDGLSAYLRHFDIQFDDNYKVTTTAEELIDSMSQDYRFKPWEEK